MTTSRDFLGHPSPKTLFDFLNGRLRDVEEEQLVSRHVDACPECLASLSTTEDDLLVNQIRAVDVNPAIPALSKGLQRARLLLAGNLIAPEVPDRFGKYESIEEVGQGGCGVVWKAYDPELRRPVALKIPRFGSLQTEKDQDRFRTEAHAVAALDHPNIVSVYEVGVVDDLSYIATEFCDGPNLAEYLSENGCLSDRLAAEIVRDLAYAIHHAHQRGVLHCDLKPANVLLSPIDGPESKREADAFRYKPKIVDFGLAKIRADSDVESYSTSGLIGTLHYMSPEAYETGKPIAASDIFALGTILYEILTEKTPYAGESPARLVQRTVNELPATPRSVRPVATDLETICLKCLEKAPSERYQSAASLADDLQRFLDGKPIFARPVGWSEQLWKWCRRQPMKASMAASILLLLVLSAIGGTFAALVFHNQDKALRIQLAQTIEAKAMAAEATKAAQRELFEKNVAQISLSSKIKTMGRRKKTIADAHEAVALWREADLADSAMKRLRDETIEALAEIDLEPDVSWPGLINADQTCIAVSHDTELYAIATNARVEIHQMSDNQLVRALEFPKVAGNLSVHRLQLKFSPNGRYLACGGIRSGVYEMPSCVWSLSSGELLLQASSSSNWWETAFDFAPDSLTIAIATATDTITQFKLPTGEELGVLTVDNRPTSIVYHRDLPRLAVVSDAKVRTLSLPAGDVISDLTIEQPLHLAWRPHRYEFAITTRAEVLIGSSEEPTGDTTEFVKLLRSDPYGVTYHPQGNIVAVSGWGNETTLFDADTHETLLQIPGSAIKFSQNGQYLANGAIGEQVGRWKFLNAEVCAKFRTPPRWTECNASFGPDSRMLAVSHADGILVWDCFQNRVIKDLSVGPVRTVHFRDDGAEVLIAGPEAVGFCRLDKISNSHWRSSSFAPLQKSLSLPISSVAITPDHATMFVSGANSSFLTRRSSECEEVNAQRTWISELSPNGRWLAVSTWHGTEFRVIDLESGVTVETISGSKGRPTFSDDSAWLAVGFVAKTVLLDTTTWQQQTFSRVPTGVVSATPAFSRSGSLLAFVTSPSTVQLYDVVKECEPVFSLTSQSLSMIDRVEFSRDDRRMVALTVTKRGIVWDLDAIRSETMAIGIPWPMPLGGAQVPKQLSTEPLLIEVDQIQ